MDVDPAPFWRLGAAANKYLEEDGKNAAGVAVYDFTDNLSAYATPVLFITGSLNEVIGEAFQQQQVQKYASASLLVVEGAGHDLEWTHTEAVLSYVREYLDMLEGGVR
jgi:pimeloyl-ACP methyl ester carboxylesterase